MIFLKRIYSDTGLFDPVEFKDGINIVLGRYSTRDDNKEINGIGKSTFVRLIDYCFISDSSKKYFDPTKRAFLKGHSCTLELEINDSVFVIKREFEKSTITFAEVGSSLDPIDYTEKEMRSLLGSKFFTQDLYDGAAESSWYRSLLSFFVQDDIDRHERSSPINFLNPSTRLSLLYVYNFFLLNLPNKNIAEFDKHSDKLRDLRDARTNIEKQAEEVSGKRFEDLEAERVQVEKKISLIQKSLKDFEFVEAYKDIQNRLVMLSVDISAKLKESQLYKRRLSVIESSYKIDLAVDIERVRSIYEDLQVGLGNVVVKPLEEVMSFRKEISENRRNFLASKERELKDSIISVSNQIAELEAQRSKLYKALDEKEAIDSIRNSYEELIEYKSILQQNLAVTGRVAELNKGIADLNVKISQDVKKIVEQKIQFDSKVAQLQSIFMDFVNGVVGQSAAIGSAFFDIKTKPDKKSPIQVTIEVPKSDSLGKSRFKILSYDLTVFFNIVEDKRNLPHFLIHDGAFHGIDAKTVIKALNYIASKSRTERFQYIFTANEPEIFIPADKEATYGKLDFKISDVAILELEDTPEKMFLKQEFQS